MDVGECSDSLLADIRSAKRIMFESLCTASNLDFLKKERAKMKKSFDHAFEHKLSTSIIVVGSSCEEAILLMKSVLSKYSSESFQSAVSNRHTKHKNYVARISGLLMMTDHEALIDISNQFMVRNGNEGNVNMALEDLEDHFKQCRTDGIPAILILEDFHIFAKRKRQTLIYTLLDLMHKKELLFTVQLCCSA